MQEGIWPKGGSGSLNGQNVMGGPQWNAGEEPVSPGEQFGFDPLGNGRPGQGPENAKWPGSGHPAESWTGSDGLRLH